MNKLIHELTRLYLVPGLVDEALLQQRYLGQHTLPVALGGSDGLTRAVVLHFPRQEGQEEMRHWHLLCEVANALQTELKLPAPGVSVSSAGGFSLWLSLAKPTPMSTTQEFVDLLRTSRFPEMEPGAIAAHALADLPPCLNAATGRWAAFINPGMGASFAEESGLEMAPPAAAQAAFLEGLKSIDARQIAEALAVLRPALAVSVVPAAPVSVPQPPGLLLKDATLEDIVRHLHARNIEPTFRHILP